MAVHRRDGEPRARSARRPTARAGALVLVAGLLLGVAGVAHAAGPTWLEGQRIEPNQGSINGLSCASPTTCLAASTVPVVQDGGLSYEPSSDPDPNTPSLNAVSCAPQTHFCMFVDNNGGAFTYDNGTFGALKDIDGDVEEDSVSCPTLDLCMAIGNDQKVFEYSAGAWDSGTTLDVTAGSSFTNYVNVSCYGPTFCVALESTDGGEEYFTWDGKKWSSASTPFDTNNHVVSLTCTSTTFCLETDEQGYAFVFNGSSWTAATQQPVDSYNSAPVLYSSCAGTSCVAVDLNDNFYQSSDGINWTSADNIKDSTSMSGITAVTCVTTICVAGDGIGDATTYSVPPAPGKPVVSGTPSVGHRLVLTHASAQTPSVWYYDEWVRCDFPDSECSLDPISKSLTGYTLGNADATKYIDAREVIGFGFDEEGPLLSNIVGPVTVPPPKPGTAKLSGSVSTTRSGVVTILLHCTGGPCKGIVKLTYLNSTIGSARYSIAAGHTATIKITLTSTGKRLLKQHKGRLTVKLVITPTGGKPTTVTVTLKVKH